jgi:hypothetical protein
MNLQQLIGELLALSNAYPDSTPITIRITESKAPLDMVMIESEDESIEIVLRG